MSILFRFSGADEFAAPTAAGVPEEEHGWVPFYHTLVGVALAAALTSPVAVQAQQNRQPDDLGALHLAPTVDEDFPAPLPAPRLWSTSQGVFWAEGDEVPTVPPLTIGAEDEYWQQLVAPARWTPPLQASSDDGNDLGDLHPFPVLDEDFSPPVVIWPAPRGQAFTADDVLVGSIVDDEGWLPPVPPAPPLRLSPWAGDQNDIVPQPAPIAADGDEWIPPGPFRPWPRPRPILWEDASADLVPASTPFGDYRATDRTVPAYRLTDQTVPNYQGRDATVPSYRLTDRTDP